MKNFCTTLIIALALATQLLAQTRIPVFVSGKDGHQSYRIPSIIGLPNGDLLAIAEGRVQHAADFGDINLERQNVERTHYARRQ
jgi:sialidase-1